MKGGFIARGVKLAELPTEAREKVESNSPMASRKLIVLGKIVQLFDGMDRREALWVLRRARNQFI